MLEKKNVLEKINQAKQVLEQFDQKKLNSKQFELNQKMNNQEIWSDQNLAVKISQELKVVETELNTVNNLQNLIENLEIALELDEENEVNRIMLKLDQELKIIADKKYFNGKFDKNGTYLNLHAGAGGIDAQDWTAMLLSMYQAFCKNQGWESSLISLQLGEEAGVKSATLEIRGNLSYGFLKEESGVHRLVRISPFNSGGTRETSFALVEAVPKDVESEFGEVQVDEKDLKWDYFMSSGKGGQGVNTTYSAVRLTHIPTNTVVTCQNERNQIQNKQTALGILKNRLALIEAQKNQELLKEIKGEFKSVEWGSQIRNYVLHPYKLVKDSRSKFETKDVDSVLERGELLDLIWSVKRSRD